MQMVRAPGIEAVQAGHWEQIAGSKHRGQEVQEQNFIGAGQERRRALMEGEMAFALSLLRQLLMPRRRWIKCRRIAIRLI